MAELTLLQKTKLALRITVDAYDSDLTDLINAAKLDLGIAGVTLPSSLDAICERAIITYCKVHFSALTDGEYARLKASYDEQKAQLVTATGYTVWGDA
jgi:hypothetical protein